MNISCLTADFLDYLSETKFSGLINQFKFQPSGLAYSKRATEAVLNAIIKSLSISANRYEVNFAMNGKCPTIKIFSLVSFKLPAKTDTGSFGFNPSFAYQNINS